MPEPKPFERLPSNIKPLHYDITLQPNLVKCVFHGSEVVDIEVRFYYFIYIFHHIFSFSAYDSGHWD